MPQFKQAFPTRIEVRQFSTASHLSDAIACNAVIDLLRIIKFCSHTYILYDYSYLLVKQALWYL